jgi:hypothetical protein
MAVVLGWRTWRSELSSGSTPATPTGPAPPEDDGLLRWASCKEARELAAPVLDRRRWPSREQVDQLYRPDHPPPHFHAQYGEEVAQIELATLRILNGSLPPRALRLVRAWARLHTEELADNWTRAQELEPLAPIEPLP